MTCSRLFSARPFLLTSTLIATLSTTLLPAVASAQPTHNGAHSTSVQNSAQPAGAHEPSDAGAEHAGVRPMLAIERVGGVSLLLGASKDGDTSASLLGVNAAGAVINPYAGPRLGLDFPVVAGLTLGGSIGLSYQSLSTESGGSSDDIGSLTLYALTPRLGYIAPLGESVSLVPRLGVTLMGAKLSPGSASASASVFATALDAELMLDTRISGPFRFLSAIGVDRTLSASVTVDSGSSNSKSSSSDIDGSLTSLHLWLGLGGHL